MSDPTDPARRYAMLTRTDREFLLSDGSGYNADDRHDRKVSILDRTRQSLTDFRLLADYCPEEWRDEIFEELPFTEEYNALDTDIAKTIEFLYVGLGGQARFRRPLSTGVSRGEVQLGNVEYSSEAVPRFAVHSGDFSFNQREAVKLVEDRNWQALESPQLFQFVRTARRADGIDFEAVRASIDKYEEYEERNHLRHYDDTVELGKDTLKQALESWALLQEHGEEFEEFLEHREEFREYLDHRQDT